MRILVLGGTRFLGRHFVEEALDAGHDLTLFNRGKSGATLYPEVELLVGDRVAGDLSALAGAPGIWLSTRRGIHYVALEVTNPMKWHPVTCTET